MTTDQINAKNAKKMHKQTKNTVSAKTLKEEFMRTILSFSNKMPNWGSLNIIIK